MIYEEANNVPDILKDNIPADDENSITLRPKWLPNI
jgi:hypothetical protein